MALFNTNSIFYCYAMHCFANYNELSSEEKKSEFYVSVESIFIYLIQFNSEINFFLSGKTAEYSDLLIAPNPLASASPKKF